MSIGCWSSRGSIDRLDSGEIPRVIVTTIQPFASATAAMIVSSGLRGRPRLLPLAIKRAHIKAAPVKGEHAAGEQGLWSFRAAGRRLELVAAFAGGFFQHTSADFRDGQRTDVEIIVILLGHPSQQRFGRRRLRDVADDVGVEQIAHQISTIRPSPSERVTSRSAPTSGERRSAATMLPFLGGSPAIVCLTASRRRDASGPSSASRRANERMRSRSTSRPSTSKRERPRSLRRVR